MGKFTVISNDAFDTLQLDAGVILSSFNPANPVRPNNDDIIATTTGGITITCQATMSDLAEDVDNAPNGLKEYMHLDGWDCSIGFTNLKLNASNTKWALGAADITEASGYKKIKPRRDLAQSDFADLWWVGDKANGGAYAVKLKNAISSDGLSIKSTKNGKGQNTQTISGHPSVNNPDDVPMEFYDIEPSETTDHLIQMTLINVTSSASGGYVEDGAEFSTTILADTGKTLDTVLVTMAGEDVTSEVYTSSTGKIEIGSVDGDVVIYAYAE